MSQVENNYGDFEEQNELLAQDLREEEVGAGSQSAEYYEKSLNDFDTDVEVIEESGIKRDADRYVWFPGNVLSAQQKMERRDFRLGGEYYGQDFPALSINKHFLQRCRITPLTERPRPIGKDELQTNTEVEKYHGAIRLAPGEQLAVRLQHVKVFPGDQLETIVHGGRNGSAKGVVELTAFRAMPYKLPETKRLVNEVQEKIFPNWIRILQGKDEMPATLREIQELIVRARDKYRSDKLIETTCKEMLAACAQFRLWGTAYLQREATRVRAGVNQQGGYVHSYSTVAEELLVQLEISRDTMSELTKTPPAVLASPAAPSSDRSSDQMDRMLEIQAETMRQNAETLKQNQAMINLLMRGDVIASGTIQIEQAKPAENENRPAQDESEKTEDKQPEDKTSDETPENKNTAPPANAPTPRLNSREIAARKAAEKQTTDNK